MPYLLTSNPPGSPTSWVKMETESVRSNQSDLAPVPPPAAPRTRPRVLGQSINNQSLTNGFGTIGKYSNYANTTVANNGFVMSGTVPNFNAALGSGFGSANYLNATTASSGHIMSNNVVSSGHNIVSSGQMPTATPPMMSPTSLFSTYSLNRNGGHHLSGFNPRTNR